MIDVIEEEGRFKIAGILDKPKLLGTKTLGYSVFELMMICQNLQKI